MTKGDHRVSGIVGISGRSGAPAERNQSIRPRVGVFLRTGTDLHTNSDSA